MLITSLSPCWSWTSYKRQPLQQHPEFVSAVPLLRKKKIYYHVESTHPPLHRCSELNQRPLPPPIPPKNTLANTSANLAARSMTPQLTWKASNTHDSYRYSLLGTRHPQGWTNTSRTVSVVGKTDQDPSCSLHLPFPFPCAEILSVPLRSLPQCC
jgi:hypothetical protein